MGLGDVALRDTKKGNFSRGEAAQTEKAECTLSEISLKIKFKMTSSYLVGILLRLFGFSLETKDEIITDQPLSLSQKG